MFVITVMIVAVSSDALLATLGDSLWQLARYAGEHAKLVRFDAGLLPYRRQAAIG